MTTSKPIANRIFQIVLYWNFISLLIILAFSWWALETLEKTAIESDRRIELEYFDHYGDKKKSHRIQSSQLISVFQPKNLENAETLPIVFQGVPVPFQGEKDILDKAYSVITHEFPEGTLYIAKDLRLFEEQEEVLVGSVLLLAIGISITSLGFAFFASKKISGPITQFTASISRLKPEESGVRIEQNFADSELNQIASAVNALIERVDENIKHEKNFIAMTSHELRTPIAVVLGAVNVLEKRDNLGDEDKKTLQRIKDATNEMSENTQSLLSLARAAKRQVQHDAFDLGELVQQLLENYVAENFAYGTRLEFKSDPGAPPLHADKSLVRILVHNLVSNALRHTTGR